jgi:hypothetical protein
MEASLGLAVSPKLSSAGDRAPSHASCLGESIHTNLVLFERYLTKFDFAMWMFGANINFIVPTCRKSGKSVYYLFMSGLQAFYKKGCLYFWTAR